MFFPCKDIPLDLGDPFFLYLQLKHQKKDG